MKKNYKINEARLEHALNDFHVDKYANVTKTISTHDVKVRTLQKRLDDMNFKFTRSSINKVFNSIQETILIEYITRLDAIDMSSKSCMIVIFVNQLLQLIESNTNRVVEFY